MTTENVQEPLIHVPVPGLSSPLYRPASEHVDRLRAAGKLAGLAEVSAQLVLTLAQAAATARGYAAAQVLREFREAISLLPTLDDADELDQGAADELDAAARRVGLLLDGLD